METEDLILSFTENCEMLIHQTHTKPQETLVFKISKPRETFSFKPSINLGYDSDWMIGLASLEVYISYFVINRANINFELYTDTFDKFSFTELKDELEEILNISIVTSEHLQDHIIGSSIISTYKN